MERLKEVLVSAKKAMLIQSTEDWLKNQEQPVSNPVEKHNNLYCIPAPALQDPAPYIGLPFF
jgi:hypothetical protein